MVPATPTPVAVEAPVAAHGVVPELAELIALRERVLAWPPPRRASAEGSGPARSPLRGRGMDYAESRPYVPGDDARHIDWRLSARTDRAHTKVFHAERDRLSLIVADTSRRLYFGTRCCFKSVQAARVGALAAWAMQRSGDRICALRGSRGEAPLAPAGGSRGVLLTLDALRRWYTQPPQEDAGIGVALEQSARLLRPGSRLLLLLDPCSLEPVADASLRALAQHQDALAVLLVDPLELAPPRIRGAFVDGGGRVELDLADPLLRRRWSLGFGERYLRQRERLQAAGWRVLQLATDGAPDEVLSCLLPSRREAR